MNFGSLGQCPNGHLVHIVHTHHLSRIIVNTVSRYGGKGHPAIFVLILIAVTAWVRHWDSLFHGMAVAAVAGPLAAIGLEAVRVIGFRVFRAMPGSMPMLMGVLITDRFMLGPNVWSNLVGWGDHVLVNRFGFALVHVLVFGGPRWSLGVPYAWLIVTIFMLSPAMTMLGDTGYFGHAMGRGFAITVYLAHTVFGLIVGAIVTRWGRVQEPLWGRHLVMRGKEGQAPTGPKSRLGCQVKPLQRLS